MRIKARFSLLPAAIILGAAIILSTPCQASLLHTATPPSSAVSDQGLADLRRALDEQRYVDAARMLDEAALARISDPRLMVLEGELDLDTGHFREALIAFAAAENSARTQAAALEGEGIALSLLGRSEESVTSLQKAVALSPGSWRAWNGLGSEYDRRAAWPLAEAAYGRALEASADNPVVLNNRGYSRLLQHRPDDAIVDLTAALKLRPGFAEARTNLRLALAMKGEYARASAAGAQEDQAALLNNAGFAAALRGEYAQAEALLNRAIKARSVYYERANENLAIVRALAERAKTTANAPP